MLTYVRVASPSGSTHQFIKDIEQNILIIRLKCGTIAANIAAAGEKGKNDGMVPGMGP